MGRGQPVEYREWEEFCNSSHNWVLWHNKWLIIPINPLNLNWSLHILNPQNWSQKSEKNFPSLALGFGCHKEKQNLVCSIQSFDLRGKLIELLIKKKFYIQDF